MLADDLEEVEPPTPCVALLSTLDPTTMAWKERDWYLGAATARTLFDRNGNAGPTIWWDGRVVGGWSQRRDGEVVYRLLEDVGSEAESAVQAGGSAHRGLDRRSADQPRLPPAVPASARVLGLHQSPRGRKISFAITSRWICDVPS